MISQRIIDQLGINGIDLMEVTIELASFSDFIENYSLEKTLECNQSFRWRREQDGYSVASQDHWCFVRQEGSTLNIVSPELDEGMQNYWLKYLGVIPTTVFPDEKFYDIMMSREYLQETYYAATGLCLMQMDPWECLVSFLISQNNNWNRIHECLAQICEAAGRPIGNSFYSFPSAEQLQPNVLVNCKLGYRMDYLYAVAAAQRDFFDVYDLTSDKCTYGEAISKLMGLRGVGLKVANCVALFSLGFPEAWVTDTWIKRAMQEAKLTLDDVRSFGKYAGLVQEYIYYYITHRW